MYPIVKILADSLSPAGTRLVTWELTYHRYIHAEFLRHRCFAHSVASSRAIPLKKMIERVRTVPAMPLWWGKNQAGMSAREELTGEKLYEARCLWEESLKRAIETATQLEKIGLHKQVANRLLEPWMPVTDIASSTHHANFFALRAHPDAQPEFQALAYAMKKLYESSEPTLLKAGEWHLPMVDPEERMWYSLEDCLKISTGRIARTSYLTHDGVRDPQEDIALHDRLLNKTEGEPLHVSPSEHQARAEDTLVRSGPFTGFTQYRKMIPRETIHDLLESTAKYPVDP